MPDRRQSLAYTKTVSMPVSRNAHQAQLPATPCWRTMSVTRLGVSAEKVVATIDTPSSHQGMERPPRKNSELDDPDFREAQRPIMRVTAKKSRMTIQSTRASCIVGVNARR